MLQIYLLFCLFAAPVSAFTTWTHSVQQGTLLHVVVPVLTGLTTAAITLVRRAYNGIDPAGLPARPHPVSTTTDRADETFGEYMRSFFVSPMVTSAIPPDEDLETYVAATVNQTELVPTSPSSISQVHRRGMVRRLLVALNEVFRLSVALNAAQRQVENFQESMFAAFPGISDFSADGMIAAATRQLLGPIIAALPEGLKPAPHETPTTTINHIADFITQTGTHIARLLSTISVSSLDELQEEVEQSAAAFDQLSGWNPSAPKWPQLANSIDQRIHEAEAAKTAADIAKDTAVAEASTLRDTVNRLQERLTAALANAGRGGGTISLSFSQKFDGDITKTRDWLGGIRMFVSARAPFFVSPTEGLAFIRGLLEGRAASWASSFSDLTETFAVPGDSLATCNRFLDALAAQFPNPTAVSDALVALRRLRQGRTPFAQFIVDFESQCHIAGWNTIDNGRQMAGELVASIRPELRNAINADLAALDIEGDINSLEWAPLRRRCLRRDPSLPFSSPAPRATPAPADKTPAAAPTPGTSAAPPAQSSDIRLRNCGITCSYDSPDPAVPRELRGRIYFGRGTLRDGSAAPADHVKAWEARHDRCVAAGVCAACRRPRSFHKGGQVFKEIGNFRSRVAAAGAGDVQQED